MSERFPGPIGHWTFYADQLTLEFDDDEDTYEMDLEECTTPAALLDWLFQVQGKGWCRPQDISDLFEILEAVCFAWFGQGVQAVFCPMEKPAMVDWRLKRITPAHYAEDA
jgi:hypothetical protein